VYTVQYFDTIGMIAVYTFATCYAAGNLCE